MEIKFKLSCLFIFLSASLFCQAQSNPNLQVVHLRCEYLENPIGIDVTVPRFSWMLRDLQNTRGQRHTAYQILIADTKELLDKDQGNLWNSGKVASSQSTLVLYRGIGLHSNQQCFWKIRCFDKDNKATAWSKVAQFSMGLLNTTDWKGGWIKNGTSLESRHIWYRKNFTLEKKIKNAFIHIASIGYHELYVNGKKVDDRILAPVLTRLDKRVLYVSYDIRSVLKPGKNTIAIWYGPGWSRYTFFKKAVDQAIRVAMYGNYSDGSDFELFSDGSWKTAESNSQNIGHVEYRDNGGELIDGRKINNNWNKASYNDNSWQSVKVLSDSFKDIRLSAQMVEPTRILDTVKAVHIIDSIKGVYKVDMGVNFTGWMKIRIVGMSKGDTVTISTADDIKTLQDFGQKNLYICNGAKSEYFCNRFNYNAGRYINISGLKRRPELSDITGYIIGTDIKRVGYFHSSNSLFNQIYETDLRTYRANTIEGFTSDCPHRERLGYGEEAFATAWGIGMPGYESGAFYKNLVRDWTDVQNADGYIYHTAPQINEHAGGPMWSSAGLNISWAYYQYYGDKQILEDIYKSAKMWLEFLNSHTKGGILRPFMNRPDFLGDWATPEGQKEWGDTPEALFFNNCVYDMNLRTFIKMATILNQSEDILKYTQRQKALQLKIQQDFYKPAIQSYSNGLQVPTAFALWQHITPDSLKEKVLAHFSEEITRTHPYLGMGSSGLPVLLHFLIENSSYDDIVAELLNKTNMPSYGYFIKQGESTWPEYWSGDVPSKIHTCYTGISTWFIKSVLGIQPDPANVGQQSFLVKPSIIKSLQSAKGAVPTLYGTVRSSWKKIGSNLQIRVSIPVNSCATLYIPIKSMSSRVLENNDVLEKSNGLKIVNKTHDCLTLILQSGKYSFLTEL